MKYLYHLLRSSISVFLVFCVSGFVAGNLTAQDTTFTVTVENESEEHPHYQEGYNEKFAINGSQNPQLTLERGKTYYFVMDNVPSFHPFYLTTDSEGLGAGSYDNGVTNNGASGNDTLIFTPPSDAPDDLYYQCTNHSFMGTGMTITGQSSQQMVFKANLSGNHVVSPVVTRAHGNVEATLNGDQLTVTGSFDNLSGSYTASHLHMAYAGSNGGVSIPLDATVDVDGAGGAFEADSNSFTLTTEQKTALMERRLYVNIHTTEYPFGELRGQVLRDADAYFRAHLTGSQVAPNGVKSRGHGMVVGEMNGDSLKVSGSFSNMPSVYTMSHIHMAIAGQNGGVAKGLAASLSSSDSTAGVYAVSDNSFQLSTEQQTALNDRKLYVNLHSKDRPVSALRGQLVAQSRATFVANLSSSNQTPAFNSKGNGTVIVELHNDTLIAHGSFNDLESGFASGIAETGAHLHTAPAGRNGGIGVHLTSNASSGVRAGTFMPSDNTVKLSGEQVTRLYNRNYYVNIHTQERQGGSVRGQVLGPATTYFRANLSGTHEVQPVESEGSGAVVAEVKDSTLIVTGSFRGLGSAFAADLRQGSHLHMAGIDANGGIEVELMADVGMNDTAGVYQVDANTYTVGTANLDALYNGEMYANIHSENTLSGELRGQLRFSPNRYPDTTMITSPADSAMVTIEGSSTSEFTAEWDGVSDTDGDQIAYVWQLSTDASFGSPIANMNVGNSTSASLTFGVLDSLLADAGLNVGESTTLHHRVLSSDGSLMSSSESKAVVVTRGDVVVSIPGEGDQLPDEVTLKGNYPNPFNPTTTIQFGLPDAQQVKLNVYNTLGRKVATLANKRYSAGQHTVSFEGAGLSSGIYIYRLETADRILTRKMTLLK